MRDTLELGDLHAEVTRKAIKHVHLSVLPPTGKVRVAAPVHVPLETIRLFVIDKLAWIRTQQRKLRAQQREAPRTYQGKESHFVWGRRRLLEVVRAETAASVQLTSRKLLLQVRPEADSQRCQAVLEAWYRQQVRQAAVAMLATWEPRLGVKAQHVAVQRMKTKWGSCTPATRSIRLNTDLAKKPRECLEYILVHELVHLLEPSHNERFLTLMDTFLPSWPQLRQRLNQLPVRHENWGY